MIDMRLGDCMELMAKLPDKAFDLAIVDPPYGIGEHGGKSASRNISTKKWKRPSGGPNYVNKGWDDAPPSPEYFFELRRVSKNQIIWGANYFPEALTPSMGWVFWDKGTSGDFSDGELAYTSFDRALQKFTFTWAGFRQGAQDGGREVRLHPTQKPVALYKWLLANYAKPEWKILDTHGGSGSIAIACHDLGFDLTWIEKDEDYYGAACERYKKHASQALLFEPEPVRLPEQKELL